MLAWLLLVQLVATKAPDPFAHEKMWNCPDQPAATLRVQDPQGHPIAGASLRLLATYGLAATEVRSDAHGVMRIPSGFVDCESVVKKTGWRADAFDVAHPPSVVTLEPAAQVTVGASSGKRPCPALQVQVEPATATAHAKIKAQDNVVELVDVAPGYLTLRAQCGLPDTQEKVVELDLAQGASEQRHLEFNPPDWDDPENHASISGRVILPHAVKPGPVEVRCGKVTRTAIVDENGAFEAKHLPEFPRCTIRMRTPVDLGGVSPSPATNAVLQAGP